MTDLELQEKLSSISLEDIFCISLGEEEFLCQDYVVSFSESFYLQHQDVIDTFVKEFCRCQRDVFHFIKLASPYFMRKDFLEIIRDNSTLSDVDFYMCSLSKEAYDILKESSSIEHIGSQSVCSELEYCYDKRLNAVVDREIKEFLQVKNILYDKELSISGELTDMQVQEICDLLKNRTVQGSITFSKMVDGNKIKKIIDCVEKLEKNQEKKTVFNIYIEDRNHFSYFDFCDKKQNSRINVFTRTDEVTDMNVYIQVEKEITKLLGDYSRFAQELSPFEKLILIHRCVSSFRPYRKEENEEDWKNSRMLHKLLFTDQIVCAGFSFLTSDLGQRLSLTISEEYAMTQRDTTTTYTHMNDIVFLDDDKYDFHGVYLMDTTFDNNESNIFIFNHFLLTPEEYSGHMKKMYTAGFSLLSVDDKEKFSNIISNRTNELLPLISILKYYYPDNELFSVAFPDYDSWKSFYLSHTDALFELARNVEVPPISESKFIQAIIHLEQVINPDISDDDLQRRVEATMGFYHKRCWELFEDGYRSFSPPQKVM